MSSSETKIYKTQFVAGVPLFKEGSPGEEAYLIDKGRVAVSVLRDGKTIRLATLGAGEVVGEMALLDEGLRTATATAVTDTEVTVLTKPLVEKLLAESDPALRLLLQMILERFRHAQGKATENAAAPNARLQSAREQALGELALVRELSEAIDQNEFNLVYQPIFRLEDGTAAGFETLIRWNHPTDGVVSPLRFIAAAEHTGLIVPIGSWILRHAFESHRKFQEVGRANGGEDKPLFISINLSTRQLEDKNLVNAIAELVEATGVDPTSIKLEITESFLMADPDSARSILHELKGLGFSIAIDDFGTGYSSLSSLHSFPIHTLKIDQSFVATMNDNPLVKKIVTAIVWLARELEMDIVAEGIEEQRDVAALLELGCNYGQGFLVSKPLAFDDAVAFLQQNQGW